jgi:hypothetical protein
MMCSDLTSNRKRMAEMTIPPQGSNKSQDAKVAHIMWYGTTTVSNRRKQGVMGSIGTAITS